MGLGCEGCVCLGKVLGGFSEDFGRVLGVFWQGWRDVFMIRATKGNSIDREILGPYLSFTTGFSSQAEGTPLFTSAASPATPT